MTDQRQSDAAPAGARESAPDVCGEAAPGVCGEAAPGVCGEAEVAAARHTAGGIDSFVPFFKAFCNGTRAGIVEQLLGGERCVCELTVGVDASQPLVSHHLAVLRATGFVRTREEGTRTYYSIDWERFDAALEEFRRFVERQRSAPTTSCACR